MALGEGWGSYINFTELSLALYCMYRVVQLMSKRKMGYRKVVELINCEGLIPKNGIKSYFIVCAVAQLAVLR